MRTILIDIYWKRFLPLSYSRPVSQLLVGIDSIAEKWERHTGEKSEFLSATYLTDKIQASSSDLKVLINSALIPSKKLVEAIGGLKPGQVLTHRSRFLAANANEDVESSLISKIEAGEDINVSDFKGEEVFFNDDLILLESPADIFACNDAILRQDYEDITEGIKTTEFRNGVRTLGEDIFIHKDAKVYESVLNAETGPIYIGANAEVMEGSLIRGPFSLGESATLKMGSKIYGATSIGKHCKAGGEINNSIINDYSNKGHDGFLGNSVIGSWCNLGADTNTSNLKNNYGPVRTWDYQSESFSDTGRQFHGLIMGDHSKAGINTMFNTGTVMGMCANVFDAGFPPKFIPSFSWGSPKGGFDEFKIEKAFEAAKAMMVRRGIDFEKRDEEIFKKVFKLDAKYRAPAL